MSKFLRVTTVAERLEIGISTAYRLIANGTIPSIKVGGARRVPEDAFESWVRSNTSSGVMTSLESGG